MTENRSCSLVLYHLVRNFHGFPSGFSGEQFHCYWFIFVVHYRVNDLGNKQKSNSMKIVASLSTSDSVHWAKTVTVVQVIHGQPVSRGCEVTPAAHTILGVLVFLLLVVCFQDLVGVPVGEHTSAHQCL